MHNRYIQIRRVACLLILLPLLATNLWAAELHWETKHRTLILTPKQTNGEVTFRAHNQSAELLEIDRIESSCGCTVSKITSKRIQPGQKTEVIAKFDKKGRKQNSQVQLRVYLKGQSKACANLTIAVEIHTAITIKPSIVYWRKGDQETTRKVEVVLDPRYAAGIESIEYDPRLFKLQTQQSDKSLTDTNFKLSP